MHQFVRKYKLAWLLHPSSDPLAVGLEFGAELGLRDPLFRGDLEMVHVAYEEGDAGFNRPD
jgi:hypothetical protein